MAVEGPASPIFRVAVQTRQPTGRLCTAASSRCS